MDELAASLGKEAVASFAGNDQNDQCWMVAIDDEHAVEIAEEPKSKCLMFAADLGQLSETASDNLPDLLLRYNHMAESNGGFHIALGPDRGLALMYKHPLEDLDQAKLFAVIQTVGEKRAAWAQIIATPEGTAPKTPSPDLPLGGVPV